jgi:hypothetical protein
LALAPLVAPCAFPSWPVSSCSVLQLSSVAGFDLLDVANDVLAEPVDVGPSATINAVPVGGENLSHG